MIAPLVALAFLALPLVAQAPQGWDDTHLRGLELVSEGKSEEAIALYEGQSHGLRTSTVPYTRLPTLTGCWLCSLPRRGPLRTLRAVAIWKFAATHFRRVAGGGSEYREPAVLQLMDVYGEDDLNQAGEVVAFARLYVEINPASAIGHIQLASALRSLGREAAATEALLAARTAVGPDYELLLATSIVDHVLKTPAARPEDGRALLDYAQPVLDDAIAREPTDRSVLLTKAAALRLRGERLEPDPNRKQTLLDESDRVFDQFSESSPNRTSPEEPAPNPLPPGYAEAQAEAESLFGRKQFLAAAAIYGKFVTSHPKFLPPHYMRLGALVAAGRGDEVDAGLEAARASVPATAELRCAAAAYLFELVYRNETIAAADAMKFLAEALLVLDEAMTLKPDYVEALVYKSLVVRTQARFETDPDKARALSSEADRLKAQADEMRKQPF